MYEDDLMNFINSLNSTTTSTETETSQEVGQTQSYNPQTNYSNDSYSQDYSSDDYSSAQNYTEQQTYNPTTNVSAEISEQKAAFQAMEVPSIEKEQPAVNLIKKRQRIRFDARMKIVASVFAVIVACLMFVTVFNFVRAKQIESTFSSKQAQINELQASISQIESEYNLVSDDGYLRDWAAENSFVEATDENTIVIKLDEMYTESQVEKVPSNWFNDVCDFFSKLFA